MSKWWDTNMADAGQALYSDPALAVTAATVPQNLTASQTQYKTDADYARSDKGGFMGAVSGVLGTADSWLSNIPGWGIAKQSVSYPIDKTATGLRWMYSNVISQPISTLLLQSARYDISGDLSGWGESWNQAEHISPGQAFMNYENTAEASGHGTALSSVWGDAGQNLSPHEKAMVKQNVDRFIYDKNYWQDKSSWKYNVGSGSLDFMFNVIDPATGAIVGGTAKTVKAARSIQLVGQEAKYAAAVPGAAGVARTRGPIVDLVVKQQTPEQVANTPSMQKAFDWMKEDGRTTEEIANHPMWGRGRRINPARYDIAKLAKDTPRNNMEQLWRFTAGDSNAASDLAKSAPEVLKKVGQTMDNRVLLEGTRMNLSMISHFKANYEADAASGAMAGKVPGATTIPEHDTNLLLEPPYPRPATPGPRQDGWDKTWGRLAQQSHINRTAAADIHAATPLHMTNPAEQTTLADGLKAEQWKVGKLQTLDSDYDELINNEKYLGSVLGQMDNWSPAASPLFGAVNKAYRMGALGLRNTESAAERATILSAGKKPKPQGSNFMMTTVKRGMGAPMTIVHNFGDRTPQGFVDHNADDARDRVFDMLKQVKGMNPEDRLGLIEIYNSGSNKVERSQALDKIHDAVMNHILVNQNKLHPDIADVLKGAIKDGISSKIQELTGKAPLGGAQRFGPTATSPDDIAKLTGESVDNLADDAKPIRSDRVISQEDGHGIVISPMAQTQLSSNDILFPVQEINRLVARSSGSFQGFRGSTGEAKDWVVKRMDGFDNLWKAATLLRPGFIPRMVSDEVMARVFKFGGMATLLDTGKGMSHFLSNRSRQVGAIVGKGSYVPATGKGIASNRAIISLDDPGLIAKAEARGLKTTRIKVPPTLRMAYGRITDEKAAQAETQAELATALKKEDADPGYIAALRGRLDDHQNVVDEYHDYVGEILRKAEVSKGVRLGDGEFKYKIGATTYKVPQAFSPQWDNPVPRDQISSENAWKNLFTRGEMIDRQRFWSHAEKTGAYKLITPDDANHMNSWLDAVNKQIRQDPFHRMIAGGMDDKAALNWMNKTSDGRKYMGQMGYWNQNKPQFARNVRFMIDKYLGDDVLKAKISNNEMVTEADLRAAFTKDEFPTVHGEEIKQHSSLKVHETANRWLDNQTEKAWKHMADIPADVLSRHPVFLQLHQTEMENLIRQQYHYKMQNFGNDTITPREWEQMNQKAAGRAKKQMSQIVYDPTNTVGSQGLRFVYPFFKPFIDGVDRWAGLVAERPEQLSKLSKIYNAPVAANLVTDTEGNHVGTDGYATITHMDPTTGKPVTEKKFVPLKDRVMHLKAPWAKPGGKEYGAIRMASLNTILPGDPWFDPGSGPIVQVAGNQLAKTSPAMGDFLQWSKILPYGPSDSTTDLFTPKYMADAYNAFMGKDVNNQKYQQAVLDIYNMKTAQYYEQLRAGGHAKPPTMDGIQKEAKNFLWLQTLTDWLSPVSVKNTPMTGTKYQFFVDQYKALQAADPLNAKDQFLSMFGEDYAGFTASLTKSMGIAASIPADKQMEKYRDLIAEDPDMAPLVVGDVYNGGAFSNSVYLKQMNDEIGGQRVRRRLTAEEAIADSRTQEGWSQYMKTTTALDAELIRAGFTSYTQNGAQVFQQAKQNLVNNLAAQNPGWAKAFGTTDRNAIPNRIKFMEKMVTDPRVMNDPLRKDAQVLRDYLVIRNQFKQMLAQRGLQQLSYDQAGNPSGQAADMGYAWRQYQMYFKNNSVQFGKVFNRYLSNDDLQ
jgi:hypothetical protein